MNGLSSTPHVLLAKAMTQERRRPRPGFPRGYSRKQLPKLRGLSEPAVRRLENCQTERVPTGMISDLCRFYDTEPDLANQLVRLAESTQKEFWWQRYSDGMAEGTWVYVQREDVAPRIVQHDSVYFPALVQCRLYMDYIADTTQVIYEPDDFSFDQAWELRRERQRRRRERRARLDVVVGEPAFHLVADDDVKRAQIDTLREFDADPDVNIGVAPYSAGRYDAIGWEFDILEFDDGAESLVRLKGRLVGPETRLGHFLRTAAALSRQKTVSLEDFLENHDA